MWDAVAIGAVCVAATRKRTLALFGACRSQGRKLAVDIAIATGRTPTAPWAVVAAVVAVALVCIDTLMSNGVDFITFFVSRSISRSKRRIDISVATSCKLTFAVLIIMIRYSVAQYNYCIIAIASTRIHLLIAGFGICSVGFEHWIDISVATLWKSALAVHIVSVYSMIVIVQSDRLVGTVTCL